MGHLYKGKGMEIIEALAHKVDTDIEFHIIGGINQDIKKWTNKINSKNVFYGHVAHNEVGKYLNALDVCLVPNQKIVLAFGSNQDGMNISDFTSPLKVFDICLIKKLLFLLICQF